MPGQGRANALVVVFVVEILLLAPFVVPTDAQSLGGYCLNDNPFSGEKDCTQFADDTPKDAASSACAAGLAMPGQSGEYSESGRCPLYSTPASFGGECSRVTDQGISVKSVLALSDGGPFGDCAGIEQVCTTFIQGEFLPSPACGGSLEDAAGGEEVGGKTESDPSSNGGSEDLPDKQQRNTIAADVETLADGFEFTEGPVWIPATGADPSLPPSTLLFSDMRTDTIFAWSDERGLETFANDSLGANGKALDGEGRLVSFRHGPRDVAVSRGAAMESATVLADNFQGKRLNSPNDGAVSPADGSVYFSDPIWGIFIRDPQGMELDRHSVYRISPDDGEVTEVLPNTAMPNGIAFSQDGEVLFVSDTGGLVSLFSISFHFYLDLTSERLFLQGGSSKPGPGGHGATGHHQSLAAGQRDGGRGGSGRTSLGHRGFQRRDVRQRSWTLDDEGRDGATEARSARPGSEGSEERRGDRLR